MSRQFKADIFLIFITAVWGVSFVLIKDIIREVPAFTYLSLRFTAAALILAVVYRKHFRKITLNVIGKGFIIGFMLFLGMALQITGLKYTTASNSAFITGLNVVIVPVISAMFLKKKPGIGSIVGVLFAGCGIFMLSGGIKLKFNVGDMLTVFCAVCFAMQIIFIDRFADKENAESLGILQIMFAAVLYSGVWLADGFKPFVISRDLIITLIITAVFGTALAYVGQTVVQRFTSPTHTALIFTAEPVFGLMAALLIPDTTGMTEPLRLSSLLGCILVLAGMLVSEFDFTKIKRIIQNKKSQIIS